MYALKWEYGFSIYLQALILFKASLEGKWALSVFGINCYVMGISYIEALHFLTGSSASCFSAIQLATEMVVCFMLLIRMRKQ